MSEDILVYILQLLLLTDIVIFLAAIKSFIVVRSFGRLQKKALCNENTGLKNK
jgi:hypothetical protein